MLPAVGIFLACLLAILAIPVSLTFSIQQRDSTQWNVNLYWLLGLFRIRLTSQRSRQKTKKLRHKKKRKIPSIFGGTRRFRPLLKNKGFIKRVAKLLKDLLRTVHVHRLAVRTRLGLNDPADTGRLWGVAGPLAVLLSNSRSADIHIEPEFTTETLDFHGEGHIRIIPLQLIYVILTFLISPATLRALKVMAAGGFK